MELVEQLRVLLQGQHDVDLAVLFGSGARGALRATSDIDLALLGTADRSARVRLLAKIERETGRVVDCVDLASAPPQLRFEIAREGVVLVEREAGLWARTRARAFLDWWEFGPLARRVHRAAAARLRERTSDGAG